MVRAAAPVPVTAKIRIGWDQRTINATETARVLEDCGIRRLAVHGRTKEQGYTGLADWDVIGAVAQAVRIPVIGNGDIACGADAVKRRSETGVAGLMIGRAAMAHPWIFSEIRAALAGEPEPRPPALRERWELIRDHCAKEILWRGDALTAMKSMRARLMAYTRGLPDSARLREGITRVTSLSELEDLASAHLARHEDGALVR